MLNFFTDPYPNELLFSAISRYHFYSGNRSTKDTNYDLYGSGTICLHHDDLDKMVENLEGIYNRKDIIFNHTFFPLDYFFDKDIIYENSYSFINGKKMHYCPDCLKDDIDKHGEAYFHREHQFIDIVICPIHRTVLKLYGDEIRFKNINDYKRLDIKNIDINVKQILDDSKHDKLWQISKLYYELICSKPKQYVNKYVLEHYYMRSLKEKGLNLENIANRRINLEKEIIEFYGNSIIKLFFKKYSNYLNLNDKEIKCYRLLRHLVLINFLGKNINDIISDIEKDYNEFVQEYSVHTFWFETFKEYVNRGFTLTEISRWMKISIYEVLEHAKKLNLEHDIKSDNLYVSIEEYEIYKRQCIELIKSNPSISRNELSRILKRKYDLIKRFDRVWLDEKAPLSLKRKRTSS